MTSSQFLKNCSSEKTTRSAQAAPWLFSTLRDNTDQSLSAVRYHFKGKHPDQKGDRKSTRLNSSHGYISYAVFCLKKKKQHRRTRFPSAAHQPTPRFPPSAPSRSSARTRSLTAWPPLSLSGCTLCRSPPPVRPLPV